MAGVKLVSWDQFYFIELIAVSECIIKENVTLAIGQCAMKVIEQTSGNDDQPEVKCLYVLNLYFFHIGPSP